MKSQGPTNGPVAPPVKRRAQDDLEPGQAPGIQRIDRGGHRGVQIEAPKEGLVDWLLSCPHPGYFVPIESESTDTL